MSNQTFVKKDRISFAVNSNEILTIAPINTNNSILFGSPTLDSNVSVVLSNQFIYADGTYLSNLPTGVTTANLVSTVIGLGTVGYISTATGGLTQNDLTSTIVGLGTFDYISSSQLISTVTGLGSVGNPATWANYPAINTVNVANNIISNADTLLVNTISSATSGYVDITSFINLQQNSIFGVNNLQTDSISANNYGIVRFDNSVDMNASVISNINAAYFGYTVTTYQDGLYMQEYTAPDASVTSPALGLYNNSIPFVGTSADNTCVNLYNINKIFYCDGSSQTTSATNIIQSTIVGLGTFGYISSATTGGITQPALNSTIIGLGTFGYISTNIVPSTIVGLGTFGYISSTQLQSTVTGLVDHLELGSTIIGLGTFGYLSSFNSISSLNISTGNLFANIVNTSTISNTDGIFTNSVSTGNLFANVINGSTINILDGISTTSLNTLLINSSTINNLTNICTTRLFTRNLTAADNGYISIGGLGLNSGVGANIGQIGFQFNNIIGSNVFTSNISAGTISTRNLGVSTLFFSTAQGYQISTNRIVGATLTENLYPLTTGAIIGFGSNTGDLGFYNEGHFRSTFTQTIQPTLDNDSFSNVVRINGNVSSQNIFVSSIFGTLISTNTLATNNLVGVGFGGAIYSQNFYPQGVNILGFGTGGPGNGPWDSASIRLTQTSSIVTNNISAGVINVSSIRGDGSQLLNLNAISSLSLQSTIVGLGTFGYISSTQLQSTVTGLIDSPEVQSTIIGLGTFGYLSTNTVPSTIIGLGAFGYISSTQLTSTVAGLGTFGYVSSLTSISTNNLSTGNLFAGVISSLQFNASSMNANRAGINILTGTNNQFNTFTENLFPNRQTATLGYTTGGESGGGWYSNINGRQFNSISTNTNIIGSATGAGDIGSTVRVLGTLSTQNQVASSITTNILFARSNVSTNVITTQILRGAGQFGNLVYTTSLLPDGGNASFGNSALTNVFNQIWGSNINTETIIPRFGNHPQSTVRILGTLSTGILNVSTILAINVNASTILVSTLNTLDINTSSITGNGSNLFNLNAISSLSLQSTVVGLGAFGYLSTNTVPSTIVGLGTFGYLSTNTVPSTIIGLGTFGYLSTNIVPSTIVGLGTFGYLSTNVVPSTIVGLGTFGYISSTQLTSTVRGLGNIYMSSFNGSTNFISSGQGSIYTLNTSSITTEYITTQGGILTVANSDLIPSVDDAYNLGSATNRWRELYVAGTSIHLGNSLILSEDIDGKLSTNAMIVSSINVENLSTGTLTADTVYSLSTITSTIATNSIFIKGDIPVIALYKPSDQETPAGALQADDTFGFVVVGSEDILIQAVRSIGVTAGSNLILNSSCNTFIGATDKVLVNAPETEIQNNASISSINTNYISSGKGINLNNNAISNVLQITHISSATTNLCLPTYKLITTTNPNAYNDSGFTQILVNPNYFTHVMPFNKYRVQLNFNALLDPAGTSFSYFYFTLSNYNSTVYPGSIYSATRPYVYLQSVVINTAFNFTDMFDMSATPPNIGDSLYVLLYAKNYDSVSIAYSNINCFVITEPVV